MQYAFSIKLNRERATRLGFRTMSLVDGPIANRRQQPTICSHIAEQQAVVRNKDICRLGTLARSVHEAQVPEERTLAAQTFLT